MSLRDNELHFWKSLYQSHKDYYAYRIQEYPYMVSHFSEFEAQQGWGIDLGCGLVSVLDGCDKRIVCMDSLMAEYDKIFPRQKCKKQYVKADAEEIWFGNLNSFDWVWCVNMMDHTPKPEKVISEMGRILRPGGTIYFQVNFDDALNTSYHYALWDESTVEHYLSQFTLVHKEIERVPECYQSKYWAVYRKEG